ncbi:MAG: CoA transferase [Haliscomenobacter sp.]|nr:CoA transferase [Haliscomenobacter sp.]MBK8878420.1 CoA transferase [Haliscomenobacter sp.]
MKREAHSKVLSGLKVVELASVLAGPAVGLFFAELGAEVLKIENKATGGDVTRRWKVPEEDASSSFSAYYACVNWGKQTLLLDLEAPGDWSVAWEAIGKADILLTNFREESAKRLGLDFARLSNAFPKLIVGQLTGYGPGDSRPAFDVVLQAEAGFLFMTGEPGRDPVKMPVALIDLLAAHQLKEGILLALLEREKTGKGGLVETSLFHSALASLANQATNWLMAAHIPQRMGSKHPNIAPYGDQFTCADGKPIVLAIGTERQFQALCDVLDLEEWKTSPRFGSNAGRVKHRQELNQGLAKAISRMERGIFLQQCQEKDIPAGCIKDMKEVFETPLAQDMLIEWTLPDGSPARSVKSVAFDLFS